MTDIVVISLLSKLDRSNTQCNASNIYFEQTLVCRVDIQLIFKYVKRNKRPILNVNFKKHPKQIQQLVKDLKMELFVNIIINFKLQTIFAKRSILDVPNVLSLPLTTTNQMFFTNNKNAISALFGTVTLTTQPRFYPFKVNRRNTKTLSKM